MSMSSTMRVEWYSHIVQGQVHYNQVGMLYAKFKAQLSRVGDNDYSLKLRCDPTVSFVSQAIIEGVKKR